MRSPLRILLPILIALVCVPPVMGDGGRNGGVVVLPNARPLPEAGTSVLLKKRISPKGRLLMELPPELEQSIMSIQMGSSLSLLNSIRRGRTIMLEPEVLQVFAKAGSVRLRFVNADGEALFLDLLFSNAEAGDLIVS